VVVQRLCCTLCFREVTESVVERQTAAAPASNRYTMAEPSVEESQIILGA
jgi:hypothetical protein